MVVSLSLIAEYSSPRFAGIVAGYPLGGAISLFFIGLEQGTDFAANSAVYTVIGLAATQAFVLGYYKVSALLININKKTNIVAASLGGLAAYLMVISALKLLPVNLTTAVVFALISIVFYNYLFKNIPNIKIKNRIKLNPKMLAARAFTAAAIILIVTGSAKLVGPKWAGLLAAFPITLFPLLVIVHVAYQTEHAHTIIKNVPRGLISLTIYAALVSLTYPELGIYQGTLIAYIGATVFLILIAFDFFFILRRRIKR